MKGRVRLAGVLLALLWATPAKADTGIIIRTTGGLPALQLFCSLPLSPCTIVGALDGTLGQVFLVTTPLDPTTFINLLGGTVGGLTGFVDAEVNQLLSLVDLTNLVPSLIPPTLMQDRNSTPYPAGSTTSAWNSYVNQPAASIVEVQNAQKSFNVMGTGIVADIDTGVDPTHPALQGVLLQGYDFTRNQPGIRFVSASPLPDLLAGESKSVYGGGAGPVHGGCARWNPICGIRPRHDGDGHYPLGGSDSETHATKGISFGRFSFPFRHFARDLLRCAEQRQRHQHEFRH